MSIAVHIPFYNKEPYKKDGFRQLTRFDYLLENIDNLKKLPIKTDIFIIMLFIGFIFVKHR